MTNHPNHSTIRALVPEDSQELFALVQAQGHDLDAFAWRARIGSVSDELAFILWARQAESTQSAVCRVVIAQGLIAGCVSLYQPHSGSFGEHAPTMQMGYWIGRDFRGQGLAVESMAALMKDACSILPEGSTAGIRTRSRNAASIRCAAKLGLSLAQTGLPSQFDPQDTDNLYVGPLFNLMQNQPAPFKIKP